jgi:hypothetical protein
MGPGEFASWLALYEHRADTGEADAALEVEEQGGNLRDYPEPAWEADSEDEIPW